MAYQSGSATSPTDLLQQLVTWLVGRGWTQDMSQADGVGWRAHLHKSGYYINLRAIMNDSGATTIWAGSVIQAGGYGIALYAGTGFNSGNGWNAQAGGPIGNGQTYTVGVNSMFTSAISVPWYGFFDDGNDNITVVVERASGVFTSFGWGNITKAGTITGGAFFFGAGPGYYQGFAGTTQPGSYSSNITVRCPVCDGDAITGSYISSFVRADVDAFTGKWLGVYYACSNAPGQGYTGKNASSTIPGGVGNLANANIPHYQNFIDRQTSSQNNQANLLPIHVFGARDAGGYSLLGTIPAVFPSTAVGDGYAAKDIIQIGADNYMLFPNFAVKKV